MAIKDSIINLILKGKDMLSPATESARKSVGGLQERSDELSKALSRLTQNQRNITEFKRLGTETDRLKQNWREAEAEVERLSSALNKAEKPTKAMARDLQRAEKAADESKAAWVRNREALDRLSPRLKAAGVDLRNLDQAQDGLEQSSRRLKSDLTSVNTQLKRQGKSAKDSGSALRDADKAAGGFSTRIRGAVAALAAFVGAAVGLDKIRQGFIAILQTGDRFEKLDQQLTQVFNSVERGEEASQWIQDFTANTPLQLEQVSQAFIRLKNFGIDPTNGTLQALVDQNEAMGGSFQDLEGLVNALGQAWAKQKLQGEEILQLIERGVPVWELLAEATGKNVTELQEMSSAGELGRETIAALVQEIGKASEGAASDSMGRLSGLVSNLRDQWDQFLNRVAESGALEYAKQQLQGLLDTILELRQNGTLERWAQNISNAMVSIGEAVKGTVGAIVEYKDQLLLLGKAFVALKVAGAVKAIGAWTVALRASRAEMMAASTQAVATSKGFSALGRTMLALAKPIPITLAIIGFEAATAAMDAITRKIRGVEDAERRLALQQKEIELQRLREINQLKRKAQALEEYASVTVRTGAEVAAMNQEQRQAYADQLSGAQEYYEYAIDALERQAAMGQDVTSELATMRGELERVNQTLKTVSDESVRAGEALRLGITKEALDAVTAFTSLKAEGLSTTDALQKAFDDLDLKTPEGITSMAQALGSLVRTAQVSGQEIKDGLMEPLQELSNQGLSQFQRKFTEVMNGAAADSQRTGQVMDSVLGEAFSRLGADLTKAQTGITQTGQSAVDAFGVVVSNIESAGRSAEQNAAILQESFTAAIAKVQTEKGIELLKGQLEQAGAAGLDTTKAMAQLKERLAEISGKELDDVKTSAESAGKEVDKLKEKTRNAKEEAEEARNKFRQAWGEAFAKAISNARQQVTELSKAARNLFETKIGGNAFVSEAESAADALEKARARTYELANARQRLMSSSLAAWFADTALAAAEVEEKFWGQAVAMENLQEKIQSGSYSMDQLDRISASAANKFDLLDNQRLSGLQQAIDAARQKMKSLADSADSTLDSLRQRLADIRGDTEEAQRLQYEAERERLQEQLKLAQQAGADEAAADYQKSLDTLEQIYQIEQRNRREEENEREQRAADRAREQEMANIERQRAAREREQASSISPARTESVKTVNVNLGGESFRVLADDEDSFVRALEKARSTSL
jgi:tape measure domain-containing protein